MKNEYDFSAGKRDKFYQPSTQLNLPVYLDADILDYLSQKAKAKGVEVNEMVNDYCARKLI